MLPQTFMKRSLNFLLVAVALLGVPSLSAQTITNLLYSENFNTDKALGWSGSGDTVAGFSSSIVTSLANNGFPTAPTSGYLAMVANSSQKPTNSGWWAVQVLTNLSTPAGLGQTDLGKISLTAKVRAKGLPPGGAVAILRIMAAGDNAGNPANYKRITFEPKLLQGTDWQTIGGFLDDTSLQAKSGSRYSFTPSTNSYEIVLELSGNNQSTAPGYVAYNSPTGPSNNGRKNPGFAPNSSIRLEVDDVVLAVVDPLNLPTAIGTISPIGAPTGSSVTITGTSFGASPVVKFNGLTAAATVNSGGTSITATVPAGATTGKITVTGTTRTATSPYDFFVTAPTNLLADPTFSKSSSAGQEYWTWFEGARLVSTSNAAPDANVNWNDLPGSAGTPFMIMPGWEGEPYAGFMQNRIAFNPSAGSFFTLTFRGKFEPNYSAEETLVTFMDGDPSPTRNFKVVDIGDQVAANLGRWATYTARYYASPADLAAMNGSLSVKVQPLERRVGGDQASVFFDDFVLTQQDAAVVGPQLTVKVGGNSYTSGATASLFAPLIGYTTPYSIVLQNDGAETLICPSVSLSGTSFAWSGGSSASLQPGESRTFTATATPTDSTPLAGTLTVLSNDKETADQTFSITLSTTPVAMSDNFESGTAADLGWTPVYDPDITRFGEDANATVSVANGALRLYVDSFNGAGTYPWYYGVRKAFASPGSIDLAKSSLIASLRAFGIVDDPNVEKNKVEVYLESLSSLGVPTGRVSLGELVDETTLGADPGVGNYFESDGIGDRVAVLLPEGGGYTSVGGSLAGGPPPQAIDEEFDPNAPAFQIVVLMTDFEFDLDADNVVEIDAMNLVLATQPFSVANGGFETDSTDFGTGTAPTGWRQFPADGVNKNLVANGTLVYNATTGLEDPNVAFQAYAGTKATKIYGQNYYLNGTWVGPSQSGVVYQEWPVAGTADILPGQAIHARGAVKVFGIDLLTGGSTFNFGFRYLNDANVPVSPDEVTTITASTDVPDQWVALVANGTVPAGATKVQLIAEFVQNNSTDTGAAYLDDVSVGLGVCPSTKQVDSKTYQLVWSDEFDGSSLNTGNWTPETGDGGWGNNEVQTYTANPENLRVKDGSLVIQAVKSNGAWTSARIKTQDKRIFKHGLIEFRAKLPTGVGPWSAAWMMGNNFGSVGWPTCGEIDVLEWRGYPTSDANTVGHALHSPQRNGGNPVEADPRSAVSNPSTQFHTYGALWKSDSVTFSVDGVDKATLEFPVEDRAAFQKEFFLLLNMAIGGTYLQGQIDPALNGATYEVDYVRVYQDLGGDATSDTTPPVITIQGANPVSLSWGTSYVDGGATAFDAGDNASVPVVTVNPVDSSVPGEYSVTYTAQDSKGNSTNTNRLVNVIMANNGNNVGADGFTDSLRYALGGTGPEPLKTFECPSSSITPGTNGTKNLVMTYFARTNENVSLLPWASANLASSNGWTTNGIIVTILSNVATNGTILEKRQATTPATNSQKFLRLRSIFTQ